MKENGKQYNKDAEKALLGVILNGGDVNEFLRVLSREDFSQLENQTLYDVFSDLNTQEVPIEPLSVVSYLNKKNLLGQIGEGPDYITQLYSSSPPASSFSYYVKIVKEATAYRNIQLLGEIAQHMSSPKSDLSPSEIIADISNRIETLTEENVSTEMKSITDVLETTLSEVATIQKGEGVSGLPTGFKDLDQHLNGLQPGQMVIIAARPGLGKALALDTPIPTPYGLRTMQQIKKGDVVFGSNNTPVMVLNTTEPMVGHTCYNVTFSTGESIVADAEHQWKVKITYEVNANSVETITEIRTTEQIYYALNTYRSTSSPHMYDYGLKSSFTIEAPPKNRFSKRKRTIHIVSVEETASVPVKCIEVDANDSLFLAGREKVPTHNSSLALDIARNAAVRQNKSVIVFSLEMSAPELGMRALGAEGYVDLKLMRVENGIDEHKWEQLQAAAERLHGKKLAIDDNPNVKMEDIKAKAKLWKQRHGLDLIVIDYIQLMNASRRIDSRQEAVSEISRSIKLLAKELEIPIIALSQLNRGPEQRSDKKPSLADLRESGSLEQDADIVLLIHREEVYDRESPRAGEADIIVAKNRAGPIGGVILSWLGKFSRFDNRTIP